MREHHAFGQSGSAARVRKHGHGFIARLIRVGKRHFVEAQQICERLGSGGSLVPGRIDAAQIRQSSQIHASDQRTIRDQDHRAGIIKLVADLALAIAGVERRRDAACERRGVIRNAVLPGIRKVNRHAFAGVKSGGDESPRGAFHERPIFAIAYAPWLGVRRIH